MTQICYSLEEAAQKLNLSETILVRLSQYFKVPAAAYEEAGYLSFKGDLLFSEPDLAFFRRVKECLVAGDSLEQAKQKVQPPASVSVQPLEKSLETSQAGQELQEIQNPALYQKTAERDFARYKSANRPSISRVFENMLKEVNHTVSPVKKSALPEAKPMRQKTALSGAQRQSTPSEKLLPFSRRHKWQTSAKALDLSNKSQTDQPEKTTGAWGQAKAQEIGWERLLGEAARHPRTLSPHLAAAAALLRERATRSRKNELHTVS